MKTAHVLGIIVALALIIFGVVYPVPEKRVDVSGRYAAYDNSWADNEGAEYIGGDAYNYQIEASLKAGYMSGVLTMKSIAFVGGLLLFFLTLYSSRILVGIEYLASSATHESDQQLRALTKLSGQIEELASNDKDNDSTKSL